MGEGEGKRKKEIEVSYSSAQSGLGPAGPLTFFFLGRDDKRLGIVARAWFSFLRDRLTLWVIRSRFATRHSLPSWDIRDIFLRFPSTSPSSKLCLLEVLPG